jgi:hypothetical protein
MKSKNWILSMGIILILLSFAATAFTAYHHMGDTDSDTVLGVYPEIEDTKLDSCALCHTGGQYEKKPGVWVSMGSCQWCHYTYKYEEPHGDILATLNPYGLDYDDYGRNADALTTIEGLDSDNDGYTNIEEISALRFPGDENDDPIKVTAPYKIYTLEQLEAMPQHTQFLLMNTHKSGDFYAQYSGVAMEDLLKDAGIMPLATGITAYAPDGWAQYHPLSPDEDPSLYHVIGIYPEAEFYYDSEADSVMNPEYGWCDYSAPSCLGRENGDPINNIGGLKAILAITREEQYLTPGELDEENKLDGEGPFRVVVPQKVPGPPDQASTSSYNDGIMWPFDNDLDHNAGSCTRSTTIIKVEPLPEDTTDIDTMEAGWDFVDQAKIIVYGAIDPTDTIQQKLAELIATLSDMDGDSFKRPQFRGIMIHQIIIARKMIEKQMYHAALHKLQEDIIKKTDGCARTGDPDINDWITEPDIQKLIYWNLHEISVLLKTLI